MARRSYQTRGCEGCGQMKCICGRFPGYMIPRWEGPARVFDSGKVDVLRLGLGVALKDDEPLWKLTAAIRFFVETGGIR